MRISAKDVLGSKKEMYLFLYKPWTLYFQYEFSCGNIWKDFFGSVHWNIDRSNCSQMFFKIVTLENFIIFTGKHLCFSVSIAKLLRTAFLWNTSGGCSGCFCTEAVLLQNRCSYKLYKIHWKTSVPESLLWIMLQASSL